MIICSCAVISDKEVREAIRLLHKNNPSAAITPSRVYKAIGRKPSCMECAPLLVRRIYKIGYEVTVNEDILKGQDVPRRLK